jgi:hypothetical protein
MSKHLRVLSPHNRVIPKCTQGKPLVVRVQERKEHLRLDDSELGMA